MRGSSRFLIVPSGAASYAWFGGLACVLWSIFVIAHANSQWRYFFGGLLGGFAVLYRQDLGPAVVACTLPFFFAMRRSMKLRYLAGAFAGVLPLVFLALAAGPSPIANNLFIFPVIYSAPGRHLPLLSGDKSVFFLFCVHVVASLTNVGAGIVAFCKQPRIAESRVVLSIALLGLFLTHQAAQRMDELHVVSAACVSISLLPISLAVVFSSRQFARVDNRTAALAVVSVIAIIEAVDPEITTFFRHAVHCGLLPCKEQAYWVEHHGRSFPRATSEEARAISVTLEVLNQLSSPGQRLFVGPADLRRTNYVDSYVYYLMPQLRPATYFIEMNPFSANRPNSRLTADVQGADWLVLNRDLDSFNEPNRSRDFGSDEPNAAVHDRFQRLGEYGTFVLFQRRRPTDTGTP
jgi:hypothetical protein